MRKLRFTIYHGLAASIAIHSALGLPVVLYALAPPPEESPTLVVELQGLVAETQSEEKVLQETKGQPQAEAAKPAESPPVQPPVSERLPPPDAERPPPEPKQAETPRPKAAGRPSRRPKRPSRRVKRLCLKRPKRPSPKRRGRPSPKRP